MNSENNGNEQHWNTIETGSKGSGSKVDSLSSNNKLEKLDIDAKTEAEGYSTFADITDRDNIVLSIDRNSILKGIILSEVLGKPKCKKRGVR